MYCFVHNKELRESYDTWKVIENLKKSGFKENSINTNDVSNNIYLQINDKNKKRGVFR